MEIERIILGILVYIGLFYLLKSLITKDNNSFKIKVIFSYIFFTFNAVVLIGSLLENKDRLIWDDVIILTTLFIFTNLWLIINFNKDKRKTNKDKFFRFTYLNGRKKLTMLVTFAISCLLLISVIVTEFKVINGWIVFLIVSTFISIAWLVLYFKDLKDKNFSSESLIVYTNDSYIKFDVSKKLFIRLSKMVDDSYILDKSRSFMIYLQEKNSRELVWILYLDKFNIEDNESINKKFLEIIKNLDCKVAEVNLDDLSSNVII